MKGFREFYLKARKRSGSESQNFGFRVSGFRVSRFGVQDSRVRVSGFRVSVPRVEGSAFRVFRVPGLGFRGFGFRVQDFRFRGSGFLGVSGFKISGVGEAPVPFLGLPLPCGVHSLEFGGSGSGVCETHHCIPGHCAHTFRVLGFRFSGLG